MFCYLIFSLPRFIGLGDVPCPRDQGGGIKQGRRSAPSVIQGLDLYAFPGAVVSPVLRVAGPDCAIKIYPEKHMEIARYWGDVSHPRRHVLLSSPPIICGVSEERGQGSSYRPPHLASEGTSV